MRLTPQFCLATGMAWFTVAVLWVACLVIEAEWLMWASATLVAAFEVRRCRRHGAPGRVGLFRSAKRSSLVLVAFTPIALKLAFEEAYRDLDALPWETIAGWWPEIVACFAISALLGAVYGAAIACVWTIGECLIDRYKRAVDVYLRPMPRRGRHEH